MIEDAIPTLVLIGVAAVLAPIIAEGLRRFLPVPEVVIQILLGIILGPYVLGLAHPSTIVTALSDFGLTYLMFLAGTELDLTTMRRGHLGRAAGSWGVSFVARARRRGRAPLRPGWCSTRVVVALCLTTTALGTLLPILRDAGVLRTRSGLRPVGGLHRRVRPHRGRRRAADQPRRPADLPRSSSSSSRSPSWRPCWRCRCIRPASSPSCAAISIPPPSCRSGSRSCS